MLSSKKALLFSTISRSRSDGLYDCWAVTTSGMCQHCCHRVIRQGFIQYLAGGKSWKDAFPGSLVVDTSLLPDKPSPKSVRVSSYLVEVQRPFTFTFHTILETCTRSRAHHFPCPQTSICFHNLPPHSPPPLLLSPSEWNWPIPVR